MFKTLNISDNSKLSDLHESKISEIIDYLSSFYISFRPILNLPSTLTFGHEIEYRNVNRNTVSEFVRNYFPTWESKVEDAISQFYLDPTLGGEISSPPLTNKKETYQALRIICNFLQDFNVSSAIHTGAHIHFGAEIYQNNSKYLLRLLKLWTAYEDIIYRFSYGEYIYARPGLITYSPPVGEKHKKFYQEFKQINDNSAYAFIAHQIDLGKNNGINFKNLTNRLNTIEIRCPNGTLDAIIIQNNLHFFAKLLLYCMSPNFDEELVNQRFNESNFNIATNELDIPKALELSDLIFEDQYDKLCFLKQYYKNGETTTGYKLTRRLTRE